jgi:hypothetical protein
MQTPLTVKQWRRVEYDRLVDLGAFRGEPIATHADTSATTGS